MLFRSPTPAPALQPAEPSAAATAPPVTPPATPAQEATAPVDPADIGQQIELDGKKWHAKARPGGGYLLTRRKEYLEPYAQALLRIEEAYRVLDAYYGTDPESQALLQRLRGLTDTKLSELALTLLPPGATDEDINRLTALYGLDKTLPQQFLIWISGVLHGDFGTSITTRQPVLALVFPLLEQAKELIVPFLCSRPRPSTDSPQ